MPLHERIKRLIPQEVLERVPDALKPPAWRDPAPGWAQGEAGVRYVPGARGRIKAKVHALADAKGKPLPKTVWLKPGEEGAIDGLGPDFVIFRRADGEAYQVYRYAVEPVGVVKWAMAEVKAPPGEQLYVWRVENAKGQGPHTSHALDDIDARLTDEEKEQYAEENENKWQYQPAPADDFSREDLAAGGFIRDPMYSWLLRGTEKSKGKLFGFLTVEDAKTWFGPTMLRVLEQKGFSLKRVPARRVWLSDSGRQVFFEPMSSRQAADMKPVEKFKWHGLPVCIEAAGGDTRHANGKYPQHIPEGWVGMGYIKDQPTFDGDSLDVIIGSAVTDKGEIEDEEVYIAIQTSPEDGSFVQFKVMFGFDSEAAAQAGYLLLWPMKMFGGIETVPRDYFLDTLLDRFTVEASRTAKRRGVGLPRSDRAIVTAIENEIGHDFGSVDVDDQRVRDKLTAVLPRMPKIESFYDAVVALVRAARQRNVLRSWGDLQDARIGGSLGGTDTVFDVLHQIGEEIDDDRLRRATIPSEVQEELLRREEEEYYQELADDDIEHDAREPEADEDIDTSFDPSRFAQRSASLASRDIVVTIPKSQLETVQAEEADVAARLEAGETGIEFYWSLSTLPKEQPRRIYFVWDGAIRAYHEVTGLDRKQGRVLMKPEIVYIEPVEHESFRGFRYLDLEPRTAASDTEIAEIVADMPIETREAAKQLMIALQPMLAAMAGVFDVLAATNQGNASQFVIMTNGRVFRTETWSRNVDLRPKFDLEVAIRDQNEVQGLYPALSHCYAVMRQFQFREPVDFSYMPVQVIKTEGDSVVFSLNALSGDNEIYSNFRISKGRRVWQVSIYGGFTSDQISEVSTALVESVRDHAISLSSEDGLAAGMGNLRSIYELQYKWSRLDQIVRERGLAGLSERAVLAYNNWRDQLDHAMQREANLMKRALETWLEERQHRDSIDSVWSGNFWSRVHGNIYELATDYAIRQGVLPESYTASEYGKWRKDLSPADVEQMALQELSTVLGFEVKFNDVSAFNKLSYAEFEQFMRNAEANFGPGMRGIWERTQMSLQNFSEQDRPRTWEEVRGALNNINKMIERWKEFSTAEKIQQFHVALTTAHNSGTMSDWIYGPGQRGNDHVTNVLTELSNMEIPAEWNREVDKLLAMPRGADAKTAMPMPTTLPDGWTIEVEENTDPNYMGGRGRIQLYLVSPDSVVAQASAVRTLYQVVDGEVVSSKRKQGPYVWQQGFVRSSQPGSGWGSFLANKLADMISARGDFFAADDSMSESAERFWTKLQVQPSVESVPWPNRMPVLRNYIDKDHEGPAVETKTPALYHVYRRRAQLDQSTVSMTLYHGSPNGEIKSFKRSEGRYNAFFGPGLYTSPFYEEAARYGQFVYELRWTGRLFEGIEELEEGGYGGPKVQVRPFRFFLDGVWYYSVEPPSAWGRYYAEHLADLDQLVGTKRTKADFLEELSWLREDADVDQQLVDKLQSLAEAAPDEEVVEVIDSTEIAGIVQAAGYDAVLISGLSLSNDTEVLIFDASKTEIENIFDTSKREARAKLVERSTRRAAVQADLQRESQRWARRKEAILPELALATSLLSSPMEDRRTHRPMVVEVAREVGVDPALLDALIWEESKYDHGATSDAGASGLMQLRPSSWKAVGADEPADVREHVSVGARYLKQLLQLFKGDVELALAAYNAGPRTVRQSGGVPSACRAFVDRVLARAQRYKKRGNYKVTSSRQPSKWEKKEYDRFIAEFNERNISERLSDSEVEKAEALVDQFFAGETSPLINWARSVVPGSFADHPAFDESMLAATFETPEAWKVDETRPLFHGSRDIASLLQEGLIAPEAQFASADPEYSFDAIWKNELWDQYKALDPALKKRIADAANGGKPIRKSDIGSVFSLFWATRNLDEAKSYGDVVEVDPSQLRYYFAFMDPYAGKGSLVFVMPSEGRQAPPSAFKKVPVQKRGQVEWDEDYGQQNAYAREYEVRRVPLSQLASPFMNPVSETRVQELAELTDSGYELPPVVVNGPDEVEETDYPHEKYPFLDGHEPQIGEEVWWLHDGHHRATLALQRGDKFIDAAVIGTTRSS